MPTKVISQQSGTITIDPCERLVLDRCVDLVVKGGTTVSGKSGHGKKQPLVSLNHCKNVRFENLMIEGTQSWADKDDWKRDVPNGLQIISSSIWIKILDISYVHDGLINRGELNNISDLTVHHFSGDAVLACADNFQIDYCYLSAPLAVFPYAEKHPDFIQLYQLDKSKVFNGLPILKNNRFLGGKLLARKSGGEKWEHGIQGIGGFDGIYENILVTDFDIQTDVEEHGISFGCLRNSTITNNRVDEATEDFDLAPPMIRVGDRKLGLASFGNTIENNDAAVAVPKSSKQQGNINIMSTDSTVTNMLSGFVKKAPRTPKSTKNKPSLATFSHAHFISAAEQLDCEPAMIEAVTIKEVMKKSPWFKPRRGAFRGQIILRILFERHVYWDQLKKQGISPKQILRNDPTAKEFLYSRPRSKYGLLTAQWGRLGKASAINQEAALKSASWSGFQIMGKYHAQCGYDNVFDFVDAMNESLDKQMEAFVSLIKHRKLDKALRERDFTEFARRYNGRAYYKRDYDGKLSRIYQRVLARDLPGKKSSNTVKSMAVTAGGGVTAGGIALNQTSMTSNSTPPVSTPSVTNVSDSSFFSNLLDFATPDMAAWLILLVLILIAGGLFSGLYAYFNDRGRFI